MLKKMHADAEKVIWLKLKEYATSYAPTAAA